MSKTIRTEIVRVRNLMRKHFKDEPEKADLWLQTSNPHLGNMRPMDLILMGRGYKLITWIKAAMEENEKD